MKTKALILSAMSCCSWQVWPETASPRSPQAAVRILRCRGDNLTDARLGYLLSLPLTGFPINLLYSAKSVGEQSISLTSKLGGCKSKRSLSSATQGFVYIFGSLIVTVS